MKIFKKVLTIIVVAVVALVAVGFVLSDEVTVTRSSVIAAEPDVIHEHLASLRTWPEWSIWSTDTDPAVRFDFAGAEAGVGARWRWKGDVFEEGELEIVTSDPERGVAYRVTMASGLSFEGGLAFTEVDGGTRVTWTDVAALGMPPLGGWAALLMKGAVDEEVGRGQEVGLAGLKARVERATTASSLRGKTLRWTFEDGPMANITFEHDLREDGAIAWRAVGPSGMSGTEAEYALTQVAPGVHVVSYLAASGYTLTVAIDVEEGRMFGIASNESAWHPMRGTFEVVN